MKNRLRFQSAFAWIVCALALLPLLLYAYLGQFSRLMSDDYCRVAIGRILGPWGSMHHWYNVHSSSYTHFFLQGLIAPLVTLVPRISPIAVFALWLIGIYWLAIQGLTTLKIERRTAKPLAVSALVLAAALSAIATEQSIFWQSAVAAYLLPLALQCLNISAVIWLSRQQNERVALLLGGTVAAAFCFLTGGLKEMFLVTQIVLLTLVLLLAISVFRSRLRRRFLVIAGAGLLASFVSLIVQVGSPGIAIRAAGIVATYGEPNRSLPFLLSNALGKTYQFVTAQNVLVAFLLLYALGMLLILMSEFTVQIQEREQRVEIVSAVWCIGLMIQLILAPILLMQLSDNPQVLGRYSWRFALIIAINVLLILVYLLALLKRRDLNIFISKQDHSVLLCTLAMGFGFVVFALAAILHNSGMDDRSRLYLSLTTLIILVTVSQQLLSAAPTQVAYRSAWMAILLYASAIVVTLVLSFVAMYGRGFVTARIMTTANFLMVVPGFVWGAFLGYTIRCKFGSAGSGGYSLRLLQLLCLVIVFFIGSRIFFTNAARVTDFQRYAEDWDAQHKSIIEQRDAGNRHIEAPRLPFDLAVEMHVSALDESPSDECAKQYYGVESITLTDS